MRCTAAGIHMSCRAVIPPPRLSMPPKAMASSGRWQRGLRQIGHDLEQTLHPAADEAVCSTSSAPQVSYADTGTYNIQFIVDRLCKSDTLNRFVEVVECEEYKPVFPTAFSPNGDGENDIIYVEGSSLGPFVLKIFC